MRKGKLTGLLIILVAVAIAVNFQLKEKAEAASTIGNNIATDGTLTVNGNTLIGDGSDDTLTLTSQLGSNLTFIKETNRTIKIDNSSGNNAGSLLTIGGTAGSGTGTGGAVTISGGQGGATASGGAVTVISGSAGVSSTADGGNLTLESGSGRGVGRAGGQVYIYAGQGTSSGSGGGITISAGAAGGGNGTGGLLTLTSGPGSGSGASGDVLIQAGTKGNTAAANTDAIIIDGKNEGDVVQIIAGSAEAGGFTNPIVDGGDILFTATDDVIFGLTNNGTVSFDAKTTSYIGTTGALDFNFSTGIAGAEAANFSIQSTSSNDNDVIAGIFIDLDDDSSAATAVLHGIRIDASDFSGQSGINGIYIDNTVEQGIILEDDLDLAFGTPDDVGGTGIARALYETADGDANALELVFPEGGATDVPVFIVGDATIQSSADLGDFNGITDPNIAVMSDDGGDHMRMYVLDTGVGHIDVNTNNTIDIDAELIVDLAVASGANGPFALCHENNGAQTTDAIKDCNGAPTADYAEQYPVSNGITYGDLVALGTREITTKDGDKITQAVKTTAAYQEDVVGIISKNESDFTSAGYNINAGDNPLPIALVGRVPVNVTSEGGKIRPGDFLAASSTPGHAMKANKAGRVIGMALSSFNASKGKVMVQVMNSFWSGPSK